MNRNRSVAGVLLAGILAAGAAGAQEPPMLVLDARAETSPGIPVVLPLDFSNGGHAITAIAFSLDVDPAGLTFDPTDSDMDGIPDSITLPAGMPSTVVIAWDAADTDGELDVLLANLTGPPLPEGVIMEFELTPVLSGVAGTWIRFSNDPAPSFSNDQGEDVEGIAVVLGSDLIFADGFESGDTGAW